MTDPDRRILLVTPTFHPEKVGTPHYATDLALTLADAGFEVTVVTNQPYYPEFRRHDGYGRSRRHDQLGPVRVHRLPTLVPTGGKPVWRAVSEANMLLQGLVALLRGQVHRGSHVIVVSPGVPFAALLGRLLRGPEGRLLVVVHDIQAGLIPTTSQALTGVLAQVARSVEAWALNQADVVAPLSPAMGEALTHLGVRAPMSPVPLWATVEPRRRELPTSAAGTVAYSGNLGRKQGVSTLADLATVMATMRPTGRLIIRGEGSERTWLESTVNSRGLTNVVFENLVPAEQLVESLAAAAVHVVPQLPEGAVAAVPSKVFNVLAVGRPVVVTAAPGTPLASLAEQTPAVRVVPPGDIDALAAEVIALLSDTDRCLELGQAGVDYVRRHATREAAVEAYLDLLGLSAGCCGHHHTERG